MAGQVSQSVFTYVLRDPRTYVPIYVGKGVWDRAHKHHFQDSPIGAHLRTMRASGFKPAITRIPVKGSDEAYELEDLLVSVIGRKDEGTGPLLNARPGGRRFTHPASTRRKISSSHVGKVLAKEHKASISKTLKGRRQSTERRQRHSIIMKQWWVARKSQVGV